MNERKKKSKRMTMKFSPCSLPVASLKQTPDWPLEENMVERLLRSPTADGIHVGYLSPCPDRCAYETEC